MVEETSLGNSRFVVQLSKGGWHLETHVSVGQSPPAVLIEDQLPSVSTALRGIPPPSVLEHLWVAN